MRIITVANGKGGVGKTTSAVYLALAAHEAHPNARVLLLDLDAQRSATDWAQIAADNNDALPFTVSYGTLQKLKSLKGYDYVLVDVAPAVSDSSLKTLAGLSSLIVVPTETEGLGLSQTYHTVDVCEDKAVVLLTRVRKRTRIYAESLNALDDAQVVRFVAEIPDSVHYKSYGMTPNTLGKYQEVWQEIEEEIG